MVPKHIHVMSMHITFLSLVLYLLTVVITYWDKLNIPAAPDHLLIPVH